MMQDAYTGLEWINLNHTAPGLIGQFILSQQD